MACTATVGENTCGSLVAFGDPQLAFQIDQSPSFGGVPFIQALWIAEMLVLGESIVIDPRYDAMGSFIHYRIATNHTFRRIVGVHLPDIRGGIDHSTPRQETGVLQGTVPLALTQMVVIRSTASASDGASNHARSQYVFAPAA